MGARAALDRIAEQDRDRAEVPIPAAAIDLAEGSPERAIELLAPVAERSDESLIPTWAAITPCSSTPPVREIGDSREAEAKLERALDLAEPEGLILPLTIIPVQGVLERHPRHRTAHATFLSTILDVRRTRSARTCATSTPSSASTAEPRRSPAPERARAPRTIPPAPASASAVRTK